MANIQYYDVILKPVITEKSMDLMADKKYTFLVHTEATKAQIKEAVEKMFEGTKVARVNTMNLEGKNRRRGMVVGKTAKTKNFQNVLNNLNVNKALVVLEDGNANAEISAKNIPDVKTARTNTINVYDILKYNTVIATKAAVATIEEVYA